MSKELVYRHFFGYGSSDCTTTVAQALIPHRLSRLSAAELFDNTYDIRKIGQVVRKELKRYGVEVYVLEKHPELSPSKFFNRVSHKLRHGPKKALFLGGIVTLARGHDYADHVVAVTAIHEGENGKKALIVDTAPSSSRSSMMRKVPLDWLDRHTTDFDEDGPTAIALIGARSG